MLAVLLAAQIAAAAAAEPPDVGETTANAGKAGAFRVYPAPRGEFTRETPNAYSVPAHCRDVVRWVTRQLPPSYRNYGELKGAMPRNLGEMPPAKAEYAVNRTVAGCPVPAPVGYHQDYLLPGMADAKPEGERSRRR